MMLGKRQTRSHICKETCLWCMSCATWHGGPTSNRTIKGYRVQRHVSIEHKDLMNLQTFSPTYPFKIWENWDPRMRVWSEMCLCDPASKVSGWDYWSWSQRRRLWRWTLGCGQDYEEKCGLRWNVRKPPLGPSYTNISMGRKRYGEKLSSNLWLLQCFPVNALYPLKREREKKKKKLCDETYNLEQLVAWQR